jgi:hypothetical protein|tara:strand:- start:183 stop:458 length:276 start_codon:yes stop_codon:yes gene_type:complete
MLDKKLQQKIIKTFKGKGGPPDCESSVIESKDEREFVELFAMASLAAKIAERCWPAVISARITSTKDGVMYKIRRKSFRGLEYCFRPTKEE